VSDPTRDEDALSAELGALRSALLEVRAPADETALRSAARARAAARAATHGPGEARPTIVGRARITHPRRVRARALAVAAAAAVAGIAVLVALRAEWARRAEGTERAEQGEQAERAAASSRASDAVTATRAAAWVPDVRPAFRPIAFARGLSTSESYSVVRVRIELVSNLRGARAPSASIEADLLVGEDGLAHAIRFDSADTLPVYAAVRSVSGEGR
jgi:hypothetical protein